MSGFYVSVHCSEADLTRVIKAMSPIGRPITVTNDSGEMIERISTKRTNRPALSAAASERHEKRSEAASKAMKKVWAKRRAAAAK